MDCREDLEFNDDSCRAEDKAKESILLMKKKMLRSHDLILQYNNKLKECERLKGDLCIAQDEALKLKQESNVNLCKIVKLEMQSTDYKKCQKDLERRLAEKDIVIAGDKCHLQQLVCKVEDIEDKHSEKLMELELEKSSLEVKVKSLEQELKALKKSHLAEVNKLEKAINQLPPKSKKGAIKFVRETKEIGVNTTEESEPAKPTKPPTADKNVLTNEFYRISDNPYPIFCDKCESLTEPSVDKICKIMTSHPPLLTEMLSPIRHCEIPGVNVSRSCQNPEAFDSNNLKFSHNDYHGSDLDPKEMNLNGFNRVDPILRNFVSPIEPMIPNGQQTNFVRPLDTSVPEIEILRRKIQTLERKIKKRKKEKSSEAPPANAGCCSHSHSANCCGHGQNHANTMPNVFPNVQSDMMSEFWNRLMKFTNDRAPKVESPRKPKKRTKIKLRRLKREKIKSTNNMRNCGSTNWEIESEDCATEKNVDNSETGNSHILRIKSSDEDTKKISRGKMLFNPVEEFTEKGAQLENSSNPASPVKVPDKPEDEGGKRVSLISDDDDDDNVEMEVESVKHEVVQDLATQTSNSEITTIEKTKLAVPNSSDADSANLSHNSESAYFSQNSATNESASMSQDADLQSNSYDSNFKTALPIDESVLNEKMDTRNSDFANTLNNSSGDKSVSVASDADLSDTPAEEYFDADSRVSSKTRKRKRSSSPKATKRTTRSNLLGKLRALKKNSITGVASATRSNSIETRGRRKLTNYSETEECDGETVENDPTSAVSENEPNPRVPTKKQRIAHVPKKENTSEEPEIPRTTRLRQVAKQICHNYGTKSTKRQKSIARSSILNDSKSEEENSKIVEKMSMPETPEIVRPSLPVGAMEIFGRGRTRAKRNVPSNSSLPFNKPLTRAASVDSSESSETSPNGKLDYTHFSKLTFTSSSPESPVSLPVIDDRTMIKQEKALKEIVNDHQDSDNTKEISEDKAPGKNNRISRKLTEKISKSIESKLTESLETADVNRAEIALFSETLDVKNESSSTKAEENLLISKSIPRDSIQIVESPKSGADGSEICLTEKETIEVAAARALPTGIEETDSPTSPASNSSLEVFQITSSKIAVSPIQSPIVYSNVKSIKPSIPSHPESPDAKTSTIPAESLNSTDSTSSSKDLPNFTNSILFAKLTESSASSRVFSKNFVSPSRISEDVAQTGDPKDTLLHFAKHQLPVLPEAHLISHLKNRQQRSSIYDKALLPISVEASPTSSLMNNFVATRLKESPTIYDRAEIDISPNTSSASTSSNNLTGQPTNVTRICDNVEKSGRSLVFYGTSEEDNIDSEIISSPGFFVDTYDNAKKKKSPTKSPMKIPAKSPTTTPTKSPTKTSTKSPLNDCAGTRNVVKELRSRQVLSEPATVANQRNRLTMKNLSNEGTIDATAHPRGILGPGTLFGRYLGEQKKKVNADKMHETCVEKLHAAEEKTVKAELNKLVDSEEWTSELHQSVIERLREAHSLRTVAKSIVDLLVEKADLGEPLDRTYTPPAPVMTKTQQRIAALISGLERDGTMPGVSELVQNGIQYTLFRLGYSPQNDVIDGLARILTAIARMNKDRERVRIFCCDSLYCLGRKSITLINTVLTVWPEVFPMHGSHEGELPNCIAHLIKLEQSCKEPAWGAAALKSMITDYYKYPQFQARSDVVATGLLQALQKNYRGDLEASILLLSKKEGTDWAYDNIVNGGLMKIVGDNNYPSSYDALSLLGFIMRTFPITDPIHAVKNILDQLYQIIESGEASPDQHEGVVSALLSLSRHTSHHDKIADTVLKWKPSQTLRVRTIEQFNAFFKMRSAVWWIQRNQLKAKKIDTVSETSK